MKKDVRTRADRLRVFRCVKAHMERHRDCPTILEVSQELGLSLPTVALHMQALDGAAGLPLRISGRRRLAGRITAERDSHQNPLKGDYEDVYLHFKRQET